MFIFKWFYLFFSILIFNVAIANGELGERIELSGEEVSIPSQLGNIKLYRDDAGFHIIKDDKIYDVQDLVVNNEQSKESDAQKNVGGKLKSIAAIAITILLCGAAYNYRYEILDCWQNFWDSLMQNVEYLERQNRKKRVYKNVRNVAETVQDIMEDGVKALKHKLSQVNARKNFLQ